MLVPVWRPLVVLLLLLPAVPVSGATEVDTELALAPIRLGDRFEYSVEIHEGNSRRAFTETAEVLASRQTADVLGRVQDVIPIVVATNPPSYLPDGSQEIIRLDYVSTEFQLVRRDRFHNESTHLENQELTAQEIGPSFFQPDETGLWWPGPHPVFFLRSPAGALCDFGDWQARSTAHRILERGTIDGREAVRAETRTVVQGAHEAFIVDTGVWDTGNPYPLEVRREVQAQHAGHTRTITITYRLAWFEPGQTPVTTEQDPSCAAPPTLHRGPAGPPGDGSRLTAAYPLDEAIRNVESDASLAPFLAWSQLHPDRRLIGFMFIQEESDTSPDFVGTEWLLSYASGSEVMDIRTARIQPGSPPQNTWWPPYEVAESPWFDDADLPKAPASIGDAEAAWAEVASERYLELGANSARWGLTNPSLRACREYSVCYEQPGREDWRDRHFHLIHLGHIVGNQLSILPGEYDWLRFNVTSGRLESYTAVRVLGAVGARSGGESPLVPTFGAAGRIVGSEVWLAGGAAGLVAVGVALLLRLLAMHGYFGGYAKIVGDDLLEHPSRRAIMDVVRARPGIGPPTLRTVLDIPWSTVMHHIGVLERGAHLRITKDANRRHLFARGTQVTEEAMVLQSHVAGRLLELVRAHPTISQSEAARRLNMTPQAVARHVRRLASMGLVNLRREGRTTCVCPT